VFTLVPNSTWCPTQALELGNELGKEVILPRNAEFSTVDNGGHLDRIGTVSFTKLLLEGLEKSKAFKSVAQQ
jgi:hypothetical protein